MTYRLIVLFVVTLMCSLILTACQSTLGHETLAIAVEEELPTVYRFTGRINQESAHRLEIALLEGDFSTIELNSQGGSIQLSIRLANLIRTLQYSTTVKSGEHCSSACVSLLMAGVGRTVEAGAYVGIHSPYIIGDRLDNLTSAEVFEFTQSHIYWYIYSNLALVKPEQQLPLLGLFLRAHHNSSRDTLYWATREELKKTGIID